MADSFTGVSTAVQRGVVPKTDGSSKVVEGEEKRDGENRRVIPVDAPNALGRGRDGALTANSHRDDLALP
ncbi:hypothetical protein MRX96_052010 [Rhipicephalus microplus]